MEGVTLMLVFVIVLAVAFDYINGFHDTANAIATSVATRALSPGHAILMATAFNFIGAFAGTAVAKTIGNGLVDEQTTTQAIVAAALIGAHRLEPDHVAAGPAELEQPRTHRRPARRDDRRRPARAPLNVGGVVNKVLIPMLTSPVARFRRSRSR